MNVYILLQYNWHLLIHFHEQESRFSFPFLKLCCYSQSNPNGNAKFKEDKRTTVKRNSCSCDESGANLKIAFCFLSHLPFAPAITSLPQNIHVLHHVPSSCYHQYEIYS